jgi:hypothetical protein
VSAVGALAIPSAQTSALFNEFALIKRQIAGSDSELKGSGLTESQVSRVLTCLLRHDALFDVSIIDTGQERDEIIHAAKREQADAILEFVTRDFPADQVAGLVAQRAEMLGLSNQLFLQTALTIKLVRRALETFINYFAQRAPKELAELCWTIDAKATDLTSSERLWRDLILPMFHLSHFSAFRWADYSSLDRHLRTVRTEASDIEARVGWNLQGILMEDLRFADSEESPGLQLVDIVTNALTRALNGRLQHKGWRSLGRLLVARNEQTIQLWTLDPAADRHDREYRPSFGRTLLRIESSARPMLRVPKGYVE